MACRILVPRPGIEPVSSALEGQSLNYWLAREIPRVVFWNKIYHLQSAWLFCLTKMPWKRPGFKISHHLAQGWGKLFMHLFSNSLQQQWCTGQEEFRVGKTVPASRSPHLHGGGRVNKLSTWRGRGGCKVPWESNSSPSLHKSKEASRLRTLGAVSPPALARKCQWGLRRLCFLSSPGPRTPVTGSWSWLHPDLAFVSGFLPFSWPACQAPTAIEWEGGLPISEKNFKLVFPVCF